ncbi:MAG: hypothetical protein JXA25_05915 [Anaerolineales bacterium]|nr:hypothetical protein [Anaerolineales bacterium]
MSKKFWIPVLLVLLILGTGLFAAYIIRLPQNIPVLDTIVLGQTRYVPGSSTAIRVLVRDYSTSDPLANAEVSLALQDSDSGKEFPLFQGTTDDTGTVEINFTVPDEEFVSPTLIVHTDSTLGEDTIEQPIQIQREYRMLLSTDKPIYQPGQIIHIRAVALSTFDLVPASNQSVEFVIADGKGNKVFRGSADTSEYGFASLDFELASEVNTGDYKIQATMGNTTSEVTIPVERYVLPKFDFSWTTNLNFYQPGETVSGSIQAAYFFGKPVDQAAITLTVYTFDYAREVFFTTEGTTDSDGLYSFEFALPDYIVGSDLDSGLGRVYLQAALTDQADHTETSNFSLPVSQQDIVIKAVPESGMIKQNLENILYIFTAYPDGTPAQTDLEIHDYNSSQVIQSISTGEYGLAEVRLTPAEPYMNIQINARDALGAQAVSEFYFEGTWEEETILLRPDRAVYTVGESMMLDLYSTAPGSRAYLDIIREGQTINTRTVQLEGQHGHVVIDLSAEMFGTLELHAYKILTSGSIVRDTRRVVVDSPRDLTINIDTNKETFLPGDTAAINFAVTNPQDSGTQAALGLSIVDEAVFALAEQDPGFARLYFLLEAEILQPRYEIHGLSIPMLVQGDPQYQDQTLQAAVEGAAIASLAETTPQDPFSLHRSTYESRVQAVYDRQQQLAGYLGNGFLLLFIILALVILGLTINKLQKEKVLGKSLLLLLGLFLVVFLAVMAFPMPDWVGYSPLSRLGYVIEEIFFRAEMSILLLLIGGLIGFIALFVYAFKQRDRQLQFSQVFMALLPFLIAAMAFLSNTVYIDFEYRLQEITIYTILAIPIAYLLRSMSFLVQRKPGWAAAAFGAPIALVIFLFAGASTAMAPGGMGMARGANDIMVEEDFFAEPMMEMAAEAPAADGEMKSSVDETSEGATSGEPRLREYFPETMYWNPEVVTDGDGNLSLDIPVADSITTWRLTAFAASADGQLGATTTGIRVFQDFFIDLDLPPALTQNDEISIPVGIFNYLTEEQTVRLVFEADQGLELLENAEKQFVIPANDIQVQYFRVRAADFGQARIKVTAYGSTMSDAIQKEITVFPDGKQFFFSQSDMLPAEGFEETVNMPEGVIPGTQQLMVKLYPGVVSQVVEGLDSMLQMPYGCFEQTSSTTYPNILVLDYLETTGQVSPEIQMKAEEYINLGYQRLTTFEVNSGGFSLFGDTPADIMLSAYAIQEFSDMNRVHPVDEALISRTADWLLNQQQNGSWQNPESFHESTLTAQTDPLPVTSYVTWSLAVAGYSDSTQVQNAIGYIKEHVGQSEDPYVLGLAANALVASQQGDELDSATMQLLDRLAGMAIIDGETAYWAGQSATFMGSEGDIADIETTALVTYAMIRANAHSDLVNKALTFIIRGKDNFGNWYSTQATMLSLKSLIESVRSGVEDNNAVITVRLNDGQTRTVQITPDTFDIVQQVAFDDVLPGPGNRVSIEVDGEGSFLYQVHGSYYLPWSEVTQVQEGTAELISIELSYDRTSLQVDDTVEVSVDVSLNQPGTAEWAIVDLGIPPGFSILGEDLTALINKYEDVPEGYEWPTIEKFELTGRQIIVYISNLSYEKPLQFSYHMQANYPLVVQSPASSAYDYYNPDINGEQVPVLLTVSD